MSIPEFLSSMQSSEVFNEFHVEHYMQASQIKPQTLFLTVNYISVVDIVDYW